MADASPSLPPFLDVPALLECSEPSSRFYARWLGFGMLAMLLIIALVGSDQSADVRRGLNLFGLVLLAASVTLSVMQARSSLRRHAAAQAGIDSAGELMQLRQWGQASLLLQNQLSSPAPSDRMRSGALVLLSAVLARYERFDDAIAVQTELLSGGHVGEGDGYGLRLGRAMAMLRQDHLVDANGALADLRRRGDAQRSAGLALLEIYRDVKTGHPTEAIEIFTKRLPVLQRQMGHRLGDAYALIARAHDMLGHTEQAALAYDCATRLAPAGELLRRYPELSPLVGRYTPAAAPAEAA